MRSETDKAYLAGFLDGEGHIGIARLRTPNGRGRHTLTVTITNRHIDALRDLAVLWGARVAGVRQRREHWSHVADLRWSTNAALRLLQEIEPYLRVKREQVKIALEFAATLRVKRSTSPITDAEWENRERLRYAMQLLNSRKPEPPRSAGIAPSLTCQHCGDTFTSYQKRRKYCSRDCSMAAGRDAYANRKASPELCQACGKTYFARPNQKFCSIECRRRGQLGHRFPQGYKPRRKTTNTT